MEPRHNNKLDDINYRKWIPAIIAGLLLAGLAIWAWQGREYDDRTETEFGSVLSDRSDSNYADNSPTAANGYLANEGGNAVPSDSMSDVYIGTDSATGVQAGQDVFGGDLTNSVGTRIKVRAEVSDVYDENAFTITPRDVATNRAILVIFDEGSAAPSRMTEGQNVIVEAVVTNMDRSEIQQRIPDTTWSDSIMGARASTPVLLVTAVNAD